MADVAFSEQIKDTIARLRRSINDLEEEQDFTDEVFYDYLRDAVDELEAGEYKRHREIKNGDFYSSNGRVQSVANAERTLYALKAHSNIKLGIKDKADRDNFMLRKNNLTVDTSGQSDNHKNTLSILDAKINKLLYQLRYSNINGVRVE